MPDDDDTRRPDSEVHRDPNAAYSARSDSPEEERFSEGQEELPESEQDEELGDFAEGQATDAGAHKTEEERFSEGQEQLPETPQKEDIGSFAEGQEGQSDDEETS